VPESSEMTEPELLASVENLCGLPVDAISYLLFCLADAAMHEGLMAVELWGPDRVACFTWGHALGEFSVEVRHEEFAIPERSDLVRVDMSDDSRWTDVLPEVVQSAEILRGPAAATDNTPIAVRLQFGARAVWIAVGEHYPDGSWVFGMDEVAAFFGDEAAQRAGLLDVP
jgi:hypothetical protein